MTVEINKMDPQKRKDIINSALKEFSQNSFQKASTNKIVEDAGVSKGLLYHYFGTKKNLYEYLEAFTLKIMEERILEKLDWNQPDIVLRLKQIVMIKFELFEEYPYLADFSVQLFQDKKTEEIIKQNPDFPFELYGQIYTKNIDYSLFKDEIDVGKAIQIFQWTLEKHKEEIMKKLKFNNKRFNYQAIEEEIYQYIDFLRLAFYKKGKNDHDRS